MTPPVPHIGNFTEGLSRSPGSLRVPGPVLHGLHHQQQQQQDAPASCLARGVSNAWPLSARAALPGGPPWVAVTSSKQVALMAQQTSPAPIRMVSLPGPAGLNAPMGISRPSTPRPATPRSATPGVNHDAASPCEAWQQQPLSARRMQPPAYGPRPGRRPPPHGAFGGEVPPGSCPGQVTPLRARPSEQQVISPRLAHSPPSWAAPAPMQWPSSSSACIPQKQLSEPSVLPNFGGGQLSPAASSVGGQWSAPLAPP